ncbi:hypothetical protein P3T37_000172 [Kitasatospora sp. MAA4]|uniref:hypothetical protein n=1 Tax=Kitasatospora sp. MAA4 TaxID=3035093 RepID=UPI002473CF2D|nr:hypothetical protein [Kitasatospora sp. MAA4]MDH6130805.1 hypothetical protein [Kitasatospora sp. MAA4]
MKPDGVGVLRGTMAHEYVEAKLLEAGMPYLSSHPDAWNGSSPKPHPEHFGAHNLAPRSFYEGDVSAEGSLSLWEYCGIDVPPIPIADDLSNLDVLVEGVKSNLRERGYELK